MTDAYPPTGTLRDDGDDGVPGKPPGESQGIPEDTLIGRTIGHYRVRRKIASGGMGTVYEAVQEAPRRTVALKVMKPGIASRSALRRFEYESQILARLRHPGIAQVFEAGTHDDGAGAVPYFAMEYIPNAKPITGYAVSRRLSTRDRLRLFAQVCDAVYHGHQKGVIHRDLKPGNILIDSSGQPKVIDFGVARATDSDLAVTTLQTDVGQLIGTLQYMSPEQCDADPHDLDMRSDVYALGVVLYELVCEQLPYDISRAALYEAARVIRESTPPRLSSFNRTLRGDIETITLKALEKDRNRRYRSAAEFGEDIHRYLQNVPIIARPPSIAYQFRTFARRNRALFTGAAAVLLVLIGGLVGMSALYVRAERARDAEARHRRTAEAREQETIAAREMEAESGRRMLVERDRAVEAQRQALHRLGEVNALIDVMNLTLSTGVTIVRNSSGGPAILELETGTTGDWTPEHCRAVMQAGGLREVGRIEEAESILAGALEAMPASHGSRDSAMLRLVVATHLAETRMALERHHDAEIPALISLRLRASAFQEDDARIQDAVRMLAAVYEAGGQHGKLAALQRDGLAYRMCPPVAGHDRATAIGALWDGRLAAHDADGALYGYDAEDDRWTALMRIDPACRAAATARTRPFVAAFDPAGEVHLLDADSGRRLGAIAGEGVPVEGVFSPDGTRLAVVTTPPWDRSGIGAESRLSVYRVPSLERILDTRLPRAGTRYGSIDWQGDVIAVAVHHQHEAVVIIEAATGAQRGEIAGSGVLSVRLSPDGTMLALGLAPTGVVLWNLADRIDRRLDGHSNWVSALAFTADGRMLATGAGDSTIRTWDVQNGMCMRVIPTGFLHRNEYTFSLHFVDRGGTLLLASSGRTGTSLWDLTADCTEPR